MGKGYLKEGYLEEGYLGPQERVRSEIYLKCEPSTDILLFFFTYESHIEKSGFFLLSQSL